MADQGIEIPHPVKVFFPGPNFYLQDDESFQTGCKTKLLLDDPTPYHDCYGPIQANEPLFYLIANLTVYI